MLNILTSKEITNCLVIVTRYYGGILLGTGGLVRAYSEATEKGLDKANVIKKDYGLEVEFFVDYANLEKLKYYFRQNSIEIIDTVYEEKIKVICEINEEKMNKLLEKKNELNFNFDDYKICCKKIIKFVE